MKKILMLILALFIVNDVQPMNQETVILGSVFLQKLSLLDPHVRAQLIANSPFFASKFCPDISFIDQLTSCVVSHVPKIIKPLKPVVKTGGKVVYAGLGFTLNHYYLVSGTLMTVVAAYMFFNSKHKWVTPSKFDAKINNFITLNENVWVKLRTQAGESISKLESQLQERIELLDKQATGLNVQLEELDKEIDSFSENKRKKAAELIEKMKDIIPQSIMPLHEAIENTFGNFSQQLDSTAQNVSQLVTETKKISKKNESNILKIFRETNNLHHDLKEEYKEDREIYQDHFMPLVKRCNNAISKIQQDQKHQKNLEQASKELEEELTALYKGLINQSREDLSDIEEAESADEASEDEVYSDEDVFESIFNSAATEEKTNFRAIRF